MSRDSDARKAENIIADRVQRIFGIFEGDLADLAVDGADPSGANDGSWMLVRDALAVADLLASMHKLGTYRDDTGRDAAVLIVRLLTAADEARRLDIRQGSNND